METTGQKSSVFCEGAAVVLLSLQGNKTFLDSGGKLSIGHCFLSEMKSLVDCYCHITPFGATTTLLLRGGCLVYLMSRTSYLMGLTITETDQSHCYDVISLHLMLFLEHRFNLTKKWRCLMKLLWLNWLRIGLLTKRLLWNILYTLFCWCSDKYLVRFRWQNYLFRRK